MKETEGEFRVPFDPFLVVSVVVFFVFRFFFRSSAQFCISLVTLVYL